MMGRTAKQHARHGDPVEGRLRNLVRRFVVTAGRGAVWKLLGIRGLDGEDEAVTAEVFHGIGFASRPAANGKPEAIVVNVGGAKVPVIVATRDHATLKAVLADLGELEAGSALVFNAGAVIYVRANGTVEIRTPGGTAKRLATLDDVQAVRDDLHQHSHTYVAPGSGGSPATTTGNPSVTAPTGTSVLKGE